MPFIFLIWNWWENNIHFCQNSVSSTSNLPNHTRTAPIKGTAHICVFYMYYNPPSLLICVQKIAPYILKYMCWFRLWLWFKNNKKRGKKSKVSWKCSSVSWYNSAPRSKSDLNFSKSEISPRIFKVPSYAEQNISGIWTYKNMWFILLCPSATREYCYFIF